MKKTVLLVVSILLAFTLSARHSMSIYPLIVNMEGGFPEERNELPEEVMPTFLLRDYTFRELKEEPIRLTIYDAESLDRLDPTLFDIFIEVENDYLYENSSVRVDRSLIFLELHPKGKWCECLFPDSLRIRMVSAPKDAAADEYGKYYQHTVFPIHCKVLKERSWLSRCLWVIVAIIALFLLFFYLRALLRKRRFKKNAQIVPVYFNRYGEEINDGAGQRLRKPGFPAWVVRWFWPGNEKTRLEFTDPACILTFFASESKEMVEIPKDGITPEMEVEGYDPYNDPVPSQPARLGPNGQVVVNNPNGRREGYLNFIPGDENDWGGLRILLILLMILSLLGAIGLIFLMIKSFI